MENTQGSLAEETTQSFFLLNKVNIFFFLFFLFPAAGTCAVCELGFSFRMHDSDFLFFFLPLCGCRWSLKRRVGEKERRGRKGDSICVDT